MAAIHQPADDAALHGLSVHPSAAVRRRFFMALLAVTLLPLLGLPLLAQLDLPFRQSFLIGLAVFIGGGGHVASTVYFYADAGARGVMRPMKGRFVALPLAVLALTIVVVIWQGGLSLDNRAVMGIFCVHLAWLYYHYQKQNYGLLAFAAAGSGARLPAHTVNILLLPPLAAGLASIPQLLGDGLEQAPPLAAHLLLLHTAAWVVYGVAAALMARLVWQHSQAFRRPWVAAFGLSAFAFYLPALLVPQLDYAFWSYGLAHGFQYLLMVGAVSRGSPMPWRALGVAVLATAAGGWCMHRLGGTHALFVCGILLTWVHFVLDAKLWRMSEPGPRQWLRSRFSYLFAR